METSSLNWLSSDSKSYKNFTILFNILSVFYLLNGWPWFFLHTICSPQHSAEHFATIPSVLKIIGTTFIFIYANLLWVKKLSNFNVLLTSACIFLVDVWLISRLFGELSSNSNRICLFLLFSLILFEKDASSSLFPSCRLYSKVRWSLWLRCIVGRRSSFDNNVAVYFNGWWPLFIWFGDKRASTQGIIT